MKRNPVISSSLRELAFQAGPLYYLMRAHDSWGERRLAELASHVEPPPSSKQQADRTIHLVYLDQLDEPHGLPKSLSNHLPEASSRSVAWTRYDNMLNCVWHNNDNQQCFWTGGSDPLLGDFRYQLPWDLMIKDISRRGGGLIHGGLVVHQGEAVLFLAPPGGGKTTTLGSATDDWQVLADDSALVWPTADGQWQASPMPTWSCLIKQTEPISVGKLALAEHYPLKAVVYLNKTKQTQLSALAAIEAAPLIYRSLNEYTATVLAAPLYRKALFRAACDMARSHSCWRLGLPLGADIWQMLAVKLRELSA